MDTNTLLNIKPETVSKSENRVVKGFERSDMSKKSEGRSEESFKSAYNEQLNTDKPVLESKEEIKEKALPQNGNELPDKESAQSGTENGSDNNLSQRSSMEHQAEQDLSENKELTDEQKELISKTLENPSLEGAVLEDEGQTINDAQQELSTAVLNDKNTHTGIDKNPSTQSDNKLNNVKVINNETESLRNFQTGQGMSSDNQDNKSNKKETALGKSVQDFQQYIENSKNKSTVVQANSSVKNFESTIKSEILNAQIQLPDKSVALNANSNVSSVLMQPGVNSLSSLSNSLSTANPNMVSLEVKPGVGKAGWSQAFNSQIMLMAGNGIQQAKLKLNPQNLGPVEVNIKLTREVAVINLSSVHLSTRDAIDGAIPRLKEMLNENGFSQVDVNVSHQDNQAQQEAAAFNRSSSQERSNNEHGNSTMPGDEQLSELNDESAEGSLLSRKLAQSLNIVDYYA